MKLTVKINTILATAALAIISIKSVSAAVNNDSVKIVKSHHALVETTRTAWWEKARFGMFIHWGIYSVIAGEYEKKYYPGYGEWIMHDAHIPVTAYKAYAKKFNPTEYNPEQWVLMAKAAGMKYIVVTTKHHDGFALFESKASDWNVVNATPYGKDLIKPLADACRKYGMKLGFYYSQANDWCNKGGAVIDGQWDEAQKGDMDEYIKKVAVPQIKEILTNYGDVAELWWDVPTDMNKDRAEKILPLLKSQPQIITNDRLGGEIKGDLFTPEQYIPSTGIKGLWETCMTINNTWGYKEMDHNWKSSQTLIRNLIEAASKGGNYLLNVGPEPTGKFPQATIERLDDIGKWMKINSESIYGTTASPFKVLPWGRATLKALKNGNNIIYLHVYNWPKDGKLIIPGLQNQIISAQLLADGKSLTFTRSNRNAYVNVPAAATSENATVIKLLIKGQPNVLPYVQMQESDGKISLLPSLADIHADKNIHSIKAETGAIQNLGYWTDAKASASWTISLKHPGTYQLESALAAVKATKIRLHSGANSINVNVEPTGSYDNYKKISLGTFKFATAGIYTISLTSGTLDWNPVNIREIILSSVK